MNCNIGDKIMIKIGNRKVETYIDEHGTQRITPINKLYNNLIESGKVDLNQLGRDYIDDKFTFKEYFEFYLSIGYSVSGFSELHNFEHLTIKNPLWDKNE